MKTSPSLMSLMRRRFATPRSAALVIVALTALAAFVIAAAPRALVGVIRDEVSYRIGEIAPSGRDLAGVSFSGPSYGSATDAELTSGWDTGAGAVLGELAQRLSDNRADFDPSVVHITDPAEFVVYTRPTAAVPEELPATSPNGEVQLAADPRLQTNLTLVEGSWPSAGEQGDAVELVLTVSAADTIVWPLGEVRSIEGASGPLDVVLVGLTEPVDAADGRWQHLPPTTAAFFFDDGNRRPTATAAAYVDAAGWSRLADEFPTQLETSAWYPVDASRAEAADPEELLAGLRRASASSLAIDDSGDHRIRFSTAVLDVLDTALARSHSASAILAVAVTGPLAVTVALIVLAAALIVRRRRPDLTLLSARGAPAARLRRLLGAEGLALGLPAAALGTVIGVAWTPADAGPVSSALALLVGVTGSLALASALSNNGSERERRDMGATPPSRLARAAQATVVVLAIVAVALLVIRGVGSTSGPVDPLVIVAPLLATVALALVVVRLHPLPLSLALRVADRGRGVVAMVGAARNIRGAAAGSTAVLAMLVAVAIAVFSSLVLATVDRGAVAAAERQVGADLHLAGPFLTADQLEAMRAVDGVAEATGLLMGDRVSVSGPDGQANATVVASDIARLSRIQEGMAGGMPAGRIVPGQTPVQAIATTPLSAEVGVGAAMAGRADVSIEASVARVLGSSVTGEVFVVDAADYEAVTGLGFYPRVALVDVTEDADLARVIADLGSVIGSAHTVESLDARTEAIRSSPAVAALRVALLAAVGLALALSVVALLLVAGVMRDERSRTIGLLRTMGLRRRQARGIIAWEFVPLGVTSLVGGIVLGAVLPVIVIASIDLRPFTGGAVQPALTVDPVLTAGLIGVVIVALGAAVVWSVAAARTTSLATILRSEED
ncbi:FtsX-like permease family protein [Microbacterium sp. C7(2022)]|uniref:FtsX-like permease family protein n=1 Tax=Microbacterium sp. C7(2022) TaxID=2992759 RepID=UPI00237AC21A|nr:ABC transporter permease [Microbacterium sp. C7(2022)]MDE0545725.1 ABC transporter permease [Microbacterium sp. C7(2022)]